MAKPFHELRERLLRAGIAPRHARRYLNELADHLADLRAEEVRAGLNPEEAQAAALLRLGNLDDLANAMIVQRKFQSWSARAPWATFGLAPLVLLAVAYLLACIYLFAGWQIFLPGAETPFGGHAAKPVYSLENLYFQLGKFYYFASPVLVCWSIALIAARQRVAVLWPMVSIFLVTGIGSAAQIRANRFTVSGIGHIGMNIDLISSLQSISDRSIHALTIFALAALPYLLWRWQQTRSISV